jgi:hypothetical protein
MSVLPKEMIREKFKESNFQTLQEITRRNPLRMSYRKYWKLGWIFTLVTLKVKTAC